MPESDPTAAEFEAAAVTCAAAVAACMAYQQWARRARWIMRAITLLNVTCVAWDAADLTDARMPLANLAGVILNALCAWKLIQRAEQLSRDERESAAHIARLKKTIEVIERVRNESRA